MSCRQGAEKRPQPLCTEFSSESGRQTHPAPWSSGPCRPLGPLRTVTRCLSPWEAQFLQAPRAEATAGVPGTREPPTCPRGSPKPQAAAPADRPQAQEASREHRRRDSPARPGLGASFSRARVGRGPGPPAALFAPAVQARAPGRQRRHVILPSGRVRPSMGLRSSSDLALRGDPSLGQVLGRSGTVSMYKKSRMLVATAGG
ncbi:hypothetical protein NDU88_008487 [Pleurodeles waltl]|uniref:Uncharacterized protein n=1 Tax=Pleurodeles waltl TaxID=8319 RepID=A0AAV7RXT1_PLEWA|nr:hypothetical protein NDU88_008487 [Pleurodeles waltl]